MLYLIIGLALFAGLYLFLTYSKKDMHKEKEMANLSQKDNSNTTLPDDFTIRQDTVWFKDLALPSIDAATFSVIDDYYAKDKNGVYHYNTYRESRDYFTTQKKNFIPIKGADPGSFVSLGYDYGKDIKFAYQMDRPFVVSDLKSLIVLSVEFCKDNVSGYINTSPIEGSDGASFEILEANYAKDKNNYYYVYPNLQGILEIKKIPCDYKSFQIMDYKYAKDYKSVYYLGKKITNADPMSFEILSNGFAKDDKAAYFEWQKLPEADANTFSVFPENQNLTGELYFSKDNKSIFANNQKFERADLATFKVLNDKYTVDKNGVYYHMKKVKGADAATFNVFPHQMGDADAEDHNNNYLDGKIIK